MRAVEGQVRPEGQAFPGVDAAIAAVESVHREALVALEWQRDGTYALLYRLAGDDAEPLEAVFADRADVYDYDVIDGGDGQLFAFVHVGERETLSELFAIAERYAPCWTHRSGTRTAGCGSRSPARKRRSKPPSTRRPSESPSTSSGSVSTCPTNRGISAG